MPRGILTVGLSGRKVGSLTIIRRASVEDTEKIPGTKSKNSWWVCKCACGNLKRYSTGALGSIRSCGCLRFANASRNGEFLKEFHTKAPGEASRYAAFATYRRSAVKRNLEFNITLNQFVAITSKPCHYCGILWSVETNKKLARSGKTNGAYKRNGIDRIDNKIGYFVGNCVPCCWECNKTKGTRPLSEWFAHIDRIVKHKNNLINTH